MRMRSRTYSTVHLYCPPRPEQDCTVADHLLESNRSEMSQANPSHLNCFIDFKSEPGCVAEEEDNDNGEQEGSHSGVPAVALGDAVVDQGGPGHKNVI